MREWNHEESREVDQVMGAFFLVRQKLFEEWGGFDERFFVYLEDVDFSSRARRVGWRSFYMAGVKAYHKGGGTSEQIKSTRLFYSLRSRILYSYKHFSCASATALLGTGGRRSGPASVSRDRSAAQNIPVNADPDGSAGTAVFAEIGPLFAVCLDGGGSEEEEVRRVDANGPATPGVVPALVASACAELSGPGDAAEGGTRAAVRNRAPVSEVTPTG